MANATGNESFSGDEGKKMKRKRNKKLLGSVRQQLEFYFSDANLRKDRFLKQEMERSEEGYVDIAAIASFNKMQVLCPDPTLIPQAISTSHLLVLSEDKTKVRRKEPLGEPEFDTDDVTVYVESLPKTVDHDWLRKVFGVCGSVQYVSLPRYRSTGDIKGFAFIEFKTPEEAKIACEMLHNPSEDDKDKMGRFPKTVGRKYVPVDEKTDKHGEAGKDHQKDLDPKRSQEDRHKDPHGSQKRKHRDSESSDGHRDTHGANKRKHRDSETSDGRKQRDDHRNQDEKKHKGQSAELDRSEKEGRRNQEKDVKITNSSSQHSQSKDGESKSRKRTHSDEKSVSEDHQHSKKTKSVLSEDGESKSNTISKKEQSDHKRKESDSRNSEHKRKHDENKDSLGHADKDVQSRKAKKRAYEDNDIASGDARKTKKESDHLDDGRSKGHDLSSDEGDRSEGEGQEENGDTRKDSDKRRRARKRKPEKKKDSKETEFQLRVISKREWLDLKQQYLSLQKASLAKMKRSLYETYTSDIAENDKKMKQIKSTEPEFTAGVVLKITSKKPIQSRQQLKDDLQGVAPVAYVDLQPGDQDGFVRCQTTEGATQIVSKYGDGAESEDVKVSLLTGEDEEKYWDKLKMDRINKLNSKQKKKKKRGVDRLLSKAEKVSISNAGKGNHVFFGDD